MFDDICGKVRAEPSVVYSLKGCMSKQNDAFYSVSFIYERMYEQAALAEHHG
jgi:hypothetical protein